MPVEAVFRCAMQQQQSRLFRLAFGRLWAYDIMHADAIYPRPPVVSRARLVVKSLDTFHGLGTGHRRVVANGGATSLARSILALCDKVPPPKPICKENKTFNLYRGGMSACSTSPELMHVACVTSPGAEEDKPCRDVRRPSNLVGYQDRPR